MPDPARRNDFCLPDLGEGLTEATIVTWLVAPGDRVVTDQPLVTVETDKAIVDIPSPQAGEVVALRVREGEILQVGEALITFAADGAARAPRDHGAVVGKLPEAPARAADHKRQSSPKASPKARQRARELAVDLTTITATGSDGIIQVVDVERSADATAGGRLDGVRRAMARRMADAHARVARATVTGEADISAWPGDQRLLLRLARAVGAACTAQPLLNASFDDATQVLAEQPMVNLGLAMETDEGLFVPVVQDLNGRSLDEAAAEIERLEHVIRDRSVRPEELRGQTITLSNFGAVGGLHAEMIVVPPQVAIVGAGRAFQRPGLEGDRLVQRRIVPLSVSFDHRVVTGVEACEFLVALTADLEQDE